MSVGVGVVGVVGVVVGVERRREREKSERESARFFSDPPLLDPPPGSQNSN
jgi:hypothetical protein